MIGGICVPVFVSSRDYEVHAGRDTLYFWWSIVCTQRKYKLLSAAMDNRMINVGFGNTVVANRILAIVKPNSSPMKKLKDEAKSNNRLIDVTEGRRTRSILILDSNHVVLSSVQRETLTQRFMPTVIDPRSTEDGQDS
jgi:regulator of extracellular matrix RemA (YlzA/DUF370 family)